jgi:hypothetical protein
MKRPGPWLATVSTLDTQTDPELERLFAAARTVVDPTPENRARVTSAVESATSRATSPSAGGAAGASRVDALRRSAAAHTGARVSGKWLAATGALTLALGFWLGHTVGRSEGGRDSAPRPQEAVRDGAVEPSAPRTSSGGDGALATSDAPPAAPETATMGTPPVELATAIPLSDSARTSHRSSPGEPRPRVASSPRANPRTRRAELALPPPATLSFREVLEQLRRARAQLDSGQATMSLLVLSELDRNAGELLLEERETTRVLALCAAGQGKAARAVAARLRESSPRSIYTMRIESSCAADSAGDTLPE